MSLSRRSFVRRLSALTALGFAVAARPLAAAAVGEEPQLWSRQALPLGLPIAEPLIDHPFVRGFALGTLPLEQALVYMDQSIPYLSNYAECFALFEGILTESEDKALARRDCGGPRVEPRPARKALGRQAQGHGQNHAAERNRALHEA